MKILRNGTVALLALTSHFAMAECIAPEPPTAVDGATADMDAMVAGQNAVKAFQSASGEFYACIDAQIAALKTAIAEGDDDAKAAAEKATEAYNANVAVEEKVAGDFNAAIRAYKKANPQ
jgi:hypothetical protein